MRRFDEVVLTVRKRLNYSILGDITGFPDRRLQIFLLGESREANQPDRKSKELIISKSVLCSQ
jgi:hypothetical protein